MRAMVLTAPRTPLVLQEIPIPVPLPHEVLIRVKFCGVCRTDLHIFDGELTFPSLPLILGHQIVGTIEKIGRDVKNHRVGEKVGVPWLGGSCQACGYCHEGHENLCDKALYTGYSKNGGFAEYCVADARYILPLPPNYSDEKMAPLLCAGLIGYRAYKLTGGAQNIGFYGFGSSAHLLTQLLAQQNKNIFAFTRPGDTEGQKFALSLDAKWAGDSTATPPELLDAAIIFAPDGSLYPQALKMVRKGGRVVSAGIHMSDIPSFPYQLLWGERSMSSVSNLTREDAKEYLQLIQKYPIYAQTTLYPLEKATQALEDLRHGRFKGAAVITVENSADNSLMR